MSIPPVLKLDLFDRSLTSKNEEKSTSNSPSDKDSSNTIPPASLSKCDEKQEYEANCQMNDNRTKNIAQEIQNLSDYLNSSVEESTQDTKNVDKCLLLQFIMMIAAQIWQGELGVNDLMYTKIREIIINKKNLNPENLGFNISVNIQDQNNQKTTKIVIESTKRNQIPTSTCNYPTENSSCKFSTSSFTDEKQQSTNFDIIKKQISNLERQAWIEFSNNYDSKDIIGEFSTFRFFVAARAQDYSKLILRDILMNFFEMSNFELRFTGSHTKDKSKWNRFDVLMKFEDAQKFFGKVQDFDKKGGYANMTIKMQKNQHRHLHIFNCPNKDVNLLYNMLLNYGEIKSYKINYKIKSHERLRNFNFPVITLHYKYDYSNWLCYSMLNNFWLIHIPIPLRVLIMQDVKKNNVSILYKSPKKR